MALQGEEPAPGDLIEIFRFGYEHWALYVGDGYVVHLTSPSEYPGADSSSIFSVLSSRGEVKKELLKDVVGGCRYRVNNKLDQKYKPLPVNKIISSAKEMVGKEVEYGVLNRNCEHFVTNLRYSIPRSPQAEHFKFMAWISLAAGTVATIGCIVKRMKQSQNHA